MSGRRKPPGGGKGPTKGKVARPAFRVVKHVDAKPTPETIRQLYMASSFIEWTPFAESMGWNSLDSRNGLPIGDWIKAKRDRFAMLQAERIAESVFQHTGRWHSDVLKTLKEYPEANDAMLGILKRRINDIIGTINTDTQRAAVAAQTGASYESQFSKIKSGELMALAAAIKVCTESKHKALLINEWSFQVAQTFSDPLQFARSEEKQKNAEWKLELIGGEQMSNAQMQEFIGRYYDRPAMPHDEDAVDAQPAAAAGGEG